MKQKKYTFAEAYNKIPYIQKKEFRNKAKKVLGVKSDNQFCNYKLGKSNLRLNQYAGLVDLFAEYGIKEPIKEIKTQHLLTVFCEKQLQKYKKLLSQE